MFTYFDDSTGLSKLVMDDFYTMRNSLTSLLDQTITINNFTTVFVSRLLIGHLFDKGDCLHVFVYVWTPSAEIWHSNTLSPADCIAELPAPGVKRPLNSW